MSRILLTSKGLNSYAGCRIILDRIKHEIIENSTIFIVSHMLDCINKMVVDNCIEYMGFKLENIYLLSDGIPDIVPDFIYVGEGNVFDLLKYMRDSGCVPYIQKVMKNDRTIYIGSSAGAMVSGIDIELGLDFDTNDVKMRDFTALHLFDGTIIPHYEPDNLKMYLRNSNESIIAKYNMILSVAEDEIIEL